jgi:integrase
LTGFFGVIRASVHINVLQLGEGKMYLWRRNNSYVFQFRIPQPHVKRFSCTHLRKNLGRVSAYDARCQAGILAAGLQRIFALADAQLPDKPADQEIVAACNWWLKTRYWRQRLDWINDLLPAELFEAKDGIARRIFEVHTEPSYDEEIGGYDRPQYLTFEDARHEFGRAAMEVGGYAYPDEDTCEKAGRTLEKLIDAIVQRRVQAVFGPNDSLLSVVLAPAIEQRCAALRSGENGKSRYAERIETACAAFLEIVGDRPLSMYTPADLQQFVTVLGAVPANMRKKKDFDGLGYRDAAQKNSRLSAPHPCLSVGTIEAYLQEFRNIWRLATAGMIGIRDITDINVTMPKGATRKAVREGLSTEALSIWLQHAAAASTPHKRWLPLLGLLTGMRLAEMVYLQPRDLVPVRGHWTLDIRTDLEFDDEEDKERPIKNTNSRRIVALHGFLVECGFVQWMQEQKGEFIFPRYHRVADPADQAQKEMGRFMRALGIHRPHVAVFHSLRHNAKDWLRRVVSHRTADIQCGHVPETVGDRYGFLTLQPNEISEIATARLPDDVDFSAYLDINPKPRVRLKGIVTKADRPDVKRKTRGRPPKPMPSRRSPDK